MRVFPDTNALFAALATRGLCSDLLRAMLAEHDVVIGAPVLAELRRILKCAARARVDIVVTGDGALLTLGQYAGIPIVSPRNLWLRLQHRRR